MDGKLARKFLFIIFSLIFFLSIPNQIVHAQTGSTVRKDYSYGNYNLSTRLTIYETNNSAFNIYGEGNLGDINLTIQIYLFQK